MRGIGVDRVVGAVRQMLVKPAVFLDRDGTLIEEVGYLRHVARHGLSSRGPSTLSAHSTRRAFPSSSSRISQAWRVDFSPRRSSSSCTGTCRRCSPRAARASTRITIVPTTPTAPWRPSAALRLPQARPRPDRPGVGGPRPRTRRSRSSSATSGSTWGRRVRPARAASSSAPDTARPRKRSRRPDLTADMVADNLIEAVGWILRNQQSPFQSAYQC